MIRRKRGGWVFQRYVQVGRGFELRDELPVEYDRRHQRFHFEQERIPLVLRSWLVALDELARLVLPGQS